jgi:hypothetical protein
MIGVSYFISGYIFSRCILGTATILTTDEKKDSEKKHRRPSAMNPVLCRRYNVPSIP